ncbi:Hypothetical protein, putative [Bodo saltans]|uniref:Membrane-associated protein n=1 Tax=Bodo saltans TaxID=75058 RepID=A0A0S4IZM0_BODSA|nr:Hypothetical protein, putative [Bodo saltans]|eukprot:CUG24401.1 Hypothetical protein, putative [Bodo saltans]
MRSIIAIAAIVAVAAAVTCPPCDQANCNAAPCTSLAPYYCAAGRSAGGCGASADSWNNTALCTSCCDTSACSSTRFTCGACSTSFCESAERCSILAPYMCTNGSSKWGCATTGSFWPNQHMCDSCCDVKTCEKKCQACTAAQCQSNPCSSADPFVCTAGPLKNGCSNVSTYFPEQSQCFSCCDATACPTQAPATTAAPQH